MQRAVAQAKAMGPYCRGVIFFRWPAFNEVLALQPDIFLLAAGEEPTNGLRARELHAVDGKCSTVECADLYLRDPQPPRNAPLRFHIASSADLEYFLPADRVPIRMSGATRLELELPPFGAKPHLYLGRAVTLAKSTYSLLEGE